MKNSTSTGASGFKGITRTTNNESNPWEASITIQQQSKHKKIYIGSYPTISVAVLAREKFIKSLF